MVEPAILDTDTLSELGRGNLQVRRRALAYLSVFGRFTTTAVTVFERLRGYRLAIREGRPVEPQLEAFETLVATSIVLPFDEDAASVAAGIWAAVSRARRHHLGDILIAAIAISRRLPIVTRNRRDFETVSKDAGIALRLWDWTRPGGTTKGGTDAD
jgi:predicted nucleic acid-binding protein